MIGILNAKHSCDQNNGMGHADIMELGGYQDRYNDCIALDYTNRVGITLFS